MRQLRHERALTMNDLYEIGFRCPNGESDLSIPMALALLGACKANPHIEIIECCVNDSVAGREEIIVIDAGDGTVAHGNPAGILRNERLAITINPNNRVPVFVLYVRRSLRFRISIQQHQTRLAHCVCTMQAGTASREVGLLSVFCEECFGG